MIGKSWVKASLLMGLGLGAVAAIAVIDGRNSLQASNMPLPQPGDSVTELSGRQTQVEQTANQFIDALSLGDY